MAIRNIIKLGEDDAALHRRARAVTKFDERLGELLTDLAETMAAGDGAGLAAPQVGVLKRAVVIDVGEGLIELVNPRILETWGEVTVVEGCLSVPERAGTVVRPEKVRVEAQDRTGRVFEITGEGLLAVCLCHEIDHLDGVLYVDKMLEDVSDRYHKVSPREPNGGDAQ